MTVSWDHGLRHSREVSAGLRIRTGIRVASLWRNSMGIAKWMWRWGLQRRRHIERAGRGQRPGGDIWSWSCSCSFERASMATTAGSVRCQRIGCDAMFTPDNNAENSCTYHSGAPLFHDGKKEWSCCKQRSHDFSDFLSLPGCTQGKHSSEKPIAKAAPSPNAKPMQMAKTGNPALDSAKAACGRCRQGFFCSNHGSLKPTVATAKLSPSPRSTEPVKKSAPAKVMDINAKQVCKRKGCGNTFTEKDNHESACSYHPGPAVFHDRLRGWKCCDVHVKEFDEFLEIPPCTKGWHDANPEDAA